jgi:integrase/recombinase XerD
MTRMKKGIEDFIALRRSFGYKFDAPAPVLRQFGDFCVNHRRSAVTVATILDWVQTYPNSTSLSISRRIRMVRAFANYWKAFDPKTEIPPRELSREQSGRSKPHIYSASEIQKILKACREFKAEPGRSNPIRRETFETIFGLIAATGLRRNEAVNLKRSHVNLKDGTLLVELTKFRKSRMIPIHPSVVRKLRRYSQLRDKKFPKASYDHFFIMNRGQPVDADSIFYAFVHACKVAGLRPTTEGAGFPRIHDLRHTFVVEVILGWLRNKKDVHALMPALSTYLGHAEPADTYWYLTGVPQLMRFGLHEGAR